MPIQGFRYTNNWAADQRPKSWREAVLMLYPNGNAPLLALTNLMKSEKVDDPEFNWWTKKMQDRRLKVTEDLDNSETAITVEGGGLLFKAGDILRSVETDELMLVTSVTNATTINVTRGFAGSTAAANDVVTTATKNPYLVCIGSVYPENSNAPTPTGNEPVKNYNYTQIFRDTFGASRTAMKTKLRTGDDVKEAKRECLEMHMLGIERALFWGRRWEGTLDNKPARTTGGIRSFIPADNIYAAGNTTDANWLMARLEQIFRFGSNEKIMFAGSVALFVINEIVRKNSDFTIYGKEKEYGMNVMRLVCPFGTLVLKNHPMFNLDRNTPSESFGKTAASSGIIVDAANLRYRYVDDTTYQPKLQDNDLDGLESGYLTECGLELHHPETFHAIDGLKAAAKDA